MANDPKKRRPRDANTRAFNIVQEATGEEPKYDPGPSDETAQARSEAGKKGGKARAESLSAEKRREIAKKAAAARWRSD